MGSFFKIDSPLYGSKSSPLFADTFNTLTEKAIEANRNTTKKDKIFTFIIYHPLDGPG